jgi:hypothetical protein
VQSSIFIIAEVLEQILHFLAVDKSLYPTLFVYQLWYRCTIPSLWKYIELKGNDLKYKYYYLDRYVYHERDHIRWERFVKIMCEKHKSAYIMNTTHLEITFYHSLINKKIKSIVNTFPNIIHLDFKESIGFSDKSLFIIAESYSNLRYINL